MTLTRSSGSARIESYFFTGDARIPNNDHLPLLIYRGALKLGGKNPASDCERLFASNHWTGAWHNGIYDYDHFHATAHEVLGVIRGEVQVRFGGANGRDVDLHPGDVVVIPVGVGHKRINADSDLLVVGAYPTGKEPESLTAAPRDLIQDGKPAFEPDLPEFDPVFGAAGPLIDRWHHDHVPAKWYSRLN